MPGTKHFFLAILLLALTACAGLRGVESGDITAQAEIQTLTFNVGAGQVNLRHAD